MRVKKIFCVFLLAIFVIVFVSATCSDEQRILRLSDDTNAHGAFWGDTEYETQICYNEIFGEYYNTELGQYRFCSGSNKILGLSDNLNAHAEIPSKTNYEKSVCYGDLECRSTTENCDAQNNEKCVVTLSSETNAHLAVCGTSNSYNLKICCKLTSSQPPMQKSSVGNLYWYDPAKSQKVNSVFEGTQVELVLEGNILAGETIDYSIYEEDFGGDDFILAGTYNNEPQSIEIVLKQWQAEWVCDGEALGICTLGDPEYYFKINLDGQEYLSNNLNPTYGLLEVIKPEADAVCGDREINQATEKCDSSAHCISAGQTNECECESGYIAQTDNNGVYTNVCKLRQDISESGCNQYLTQQTCEDALVSDGKETVRQSFLENKGKEIKCFDDSGPHEDENPNNIIDWIGEYPVWIENCRCEWKSGKCVGWYDEFFDPDKDGPEPKKELGSCSILRSLIGDCDVDEFLTFTYDNQWNWGECVDYDPGQDYVVDGSQWCYDPSGNSKQTCEEVKETKVACPSQVSTLSFFTSLNLVISLIVIMIIYSWMIFKEKDF